MSADPLAEWLATRPPQIQELVRRFPPNSVFDVPGVGLLYLVGYLEDGGVTVSPVDPEKFYDRALATRMVLSAQELADARSLGWWRRGDASTEN